MSRPIGFELHGEGNPAYPPMNSSPTYGAGYGTNNYPPPPMAGHDPGYPPPASYMASPYGRGSVEPPVAPPSVAIPSYSPTPGPPGLTPVNDTATPVVGFEGVGQNGGFNDSDTTLTSLSRPTTGSGRQRPGSVRPGSKPLSVRESARGLLHDEEATKIDYRETEV